MRGEGGGRRRTCTDAFTLVELLIVVLVIGVLVAVAVPTFAGVRTRSQDAAARSSLGIAVRAVASADDLAALSAQAMTAVEPSLGWDEGVPVHAGRVGLHRAADGDLGLAVRSSSGSCFGARIDPNRTVAWSSWTGAACHPALAATVPGSASPATTAASLPSGAVVGANGHVYVRNATEQTPGQAATAAAASTTLGMTGHLATITSAEEQQTVASLVAGTWGAWLGASDGTIEGDWRWTAGSEAGTPFWSGAAPANGGTPVAGRFVTWGSGEPNNSGNEDCMTIRGDGLWNDRLCTDLVASIIEYGSS